MSEPSQQKPEAHAVDAVAAMKKTRVFTGCDYFSCQLQVQTTSADGKTALVAPCHASLVVSSQEFTITTMKEVRMHMTPPPPPHPTPLLSQPPSPIPHRADAA
jgi:hypothetical protein